MNRTFEKKTREYRIKQNKTNEQEQNEFTQYVEPEQAFTTKSTVNATIDPAIPGKYYIFIDHVLTLSDGLECSVARITPRDVTPARPRALALHG